MNESIENNPANEKNLTAAGIKFPFLSAMLISNPFVAINPFSTEFNRKEPNFCGIAKEQTMLIIIITELNRNRISKIFETVFAIFEIFFIFSPLVNIFDCIIAAELFFVNKFLSFFDKLFFLVKNI